MIQYFPIVTGSLTVLGNISVSGSITTSGSITISGSITSASFASTASYWSGSIVNAESASFASTASFVALAQSASNAVSAVTASFANAFTVAGNLTAQTLVVQTITSSVDFVTGSTRFGSLLGNTHVFSGSVTMNPGGLFVSSSGTVGIGTATPGTRLEVFSTAASADRTLPHNVLTLTAEQGNAPYGPFGGAILFKNRSYTSGLVESSRIRSVIYDDGAPSNFGGGLWFETTPTPGGALTSSVVINYQGRVGIGTTSPTNTLTIQNTGENAIEWHRSNVMRGMIGVPSASNQIIQGSVLNDFCFRSTTQMLFATGGETERMRITTTTPNNMTCVLVNKTTAGGSYPFQVAGSNGAIITSATGVGDANYYSTSNTIGFHFYADRGASGVFWVATNGDVRNANNSYGSTSDIKLKENIIDATPKLNDLLKVKIRNYNFISDELKTKQLGVIAQELEEIFPNMVSEEKQMNSEETIKTVKYSIFVPMLIKAIQELNTKFEEYKATHP